MSEESSTESFEEGFKAGIRSGRRLAEIRILEEVKKIEAQSHSTRTPIYQETFFKKIKEIIDANPR